MKRRCLGSVLLLPLLLLGFSPLSAQNVKRGHFTFSLHGGSLGGVEFLTKYGGGNFGNLLGLEWDLDAEKFYVEKKSAGFYGFSLGYAIGTSAQLAHGNFRFTWYGELTYCSPVKWADGVETRAWLDWNIPNFQSFTVTETYAQTDRKAGLYGATLGIIYMPFRKIPLGIDLGVGVWKFSQEYTSGTRRFFEGKMDARSVDEQSANLGFSYSGQGRLQRNHTALLIKVGLTYKPFRFLSFDADMRTASFVYSYDTDLVWEESGEPYIGTGTQKLGALYSVGITFHL